MPIQFAEARRKCIWHFPLVSAHCLSGKGVVQMLDTIALATYTLVMSITPGPNNVMVLASGARFGLRRTLPHLAGITLGFTAQAILVAVGLGTVLYGVPQVRMVMQWIGVAYMLYLAIRLLRAGPVTEAERSRPLSIWEGAAFQAVNPKAWVMALTTASVFAPGVGRLTPGLMVMALILAAINFPCVTSWAAFGSGIRVWLNEPRRRMLFNVIMAALMVWTGWSMMPG
jgi:threonine/homoserine/homoserine lactone efflux protein